MIGLSLCGRNDKNTGAENAGGDCSEYGNPIGFSGSTTLIVTLSNRSFIFSLRHQFGFLPTKYVFQSGIYYYYYYYYKICIAHKFKHARVGGAGVAGWENGLAGEGK